MEANIRVSRNWTSQMELYRPTTMNRTSPRFSLAYSPNGIRRKWLKGVGDWWSPSSLSRTWPLGQYVPGQGNVKMERLLDDSLQPTGSYIMGQAWHRIRSRTSKPSSHTIDKSPIAKETFYVTNFILRSLTHKKERKGVPDYVYHVKLLEIEENTSIYIIKPAWEQFTPYCRFLTWCYA